MKFSNAAAFSLCLATAAVSQAADIAWKTPGTAGTFGTAANWTGGVAPTTGDVAIIDGETATATTVTFNTGNILSGLTVSAGDTLKLTYQAGFAAGTTTTLNGTISNQLSSGTLDIRSTMTIGSGGVLENTTSGGTITIRTSSPTPALANSGLIHASAGGIQLYGNITGGALTIDSGATLGNVDVQGAYTLTNMTINNAGTFESRGVAGSGGRTKSVAIDGGTFNNTGTFQVVSSETNANTGNKTLSMTVGSGTNVTSFSNSGTINVQNTDASTYVDPATLAFGANATLNNSGIVNVQFNSANTTAGNIAALTSVNSVTNTNTLTVDGSLASLTVSGAGKSYTQTAGTTTVKNGATLTAPSFAISGGTVAGTAKLSGVSTFSGTAIVAPGIDVGNVKGTGTLSLGGNTTLGSGSTLAIDLLNASTFDQAAVTGTVTLGGSLAINLGYVPTLGDSFTIIDNDGSDAVNGTFAGLAEGASITAAFNNISYRFAISYAGGTGNDVVLTNVAVPEPAALTVGCAAVAFLLRRKRGQ